MHVDVLRQVKAWLEHATYGVNALRTAVPDDAGDAALASVTVLEASSTAWVARGLIDRTQVGTSALLLVQLAEEGQTTLVEDGREVPTQAQVPVVIRFVIRKTDSAAGLTQAYSTLRVVARSLMLQAARTSVTRNTTTIGPVLGLSFVPALQEVADDYVVDGIQVVLGVWDAWALGAT